MLGQQDVGHRIVVRRIVGNRGGRTLFSDALGELVELTENHLTVLTAQGPLRVPLAQVHRAKRVPPARRPRASDVTEIELAANEAWPAPEQGRLGGWLLRCADGWTGRANSALPVGEPDRPLEAAIDAVERWYAERGRPALINVPLPLAAPINAALDRRAWAARPPVLVQTARLATLLATPPAPAGLPPVRLLPEPSADWLAIVTARLARRSASPSAPPAVPPAPPTAPSAAPPAVPPAPLWHLLTAVPQVCFAHLYASGGADRDTPGELIGVARGTVTGDGRWLGLTLLEVVPDARGRGIGRQLVRALAGWAADLGATGLFLQVEKENTAAVALYRGLGLRTHHTYVTRAEPVAGR